MILVGIDVAKDKHDCCIINSDGCLLYTSIKSSVLLLFLRPSSSSISFNLFFPAHIKKGAVSGVCHRFHRIDAVLRLSLIHISFS